MTSPRDNKYYSVGKLVETVKQLKCDVCDLLTLTEVTFEEFSLLYETETMISAGAENINGVGSATISSNFGKIKVYFNGTDYFII